MVDSCQYNNSSLAGYQDQNCQVILNDIPAGLLVLDENKIIFANNAATSLLRARSLTDICGLYISDISPTTQPDGSSSAATIQNLLRSVYYTDSKRLYVLSGKKRYVFADCFCEIE